jgi:glucokinase
VTERVLVGDIGGTNARFALLDAEAALACGHWQLEQVITLATVDFDTIDAAIQAYFQQAGVSDGAVTRACLALACPVDGEEIRMTNNHWRFRRQSLAAALGLKQLKLVNDFTAMALGMLCVEDHELLPVGGGESMPRAARLVIGPGTGLGVSGLVPTSGGWVPLASEGGHTSLAPQDELEDAILGGFRKRYGRVSVERVLCGQGLLELYQIMAELAAEPVTLATPADITAAALADSGSFAAQVLDRFFRMLGTVAGDNVVTLGARGGVYLCGGILPRVQTLFLHSSFRAGFEDKGRFRDYLANVPVWLCVAANPGLLGAAAALENAEVRG